MYTEVSFNANINMSVYSDEQYKMCADLKKYIYVFIVCFVSLQFVYNPIMFSKCIVHGDLTYKDI